MVRDFARERRWLLLWTIAIVIRLIVMPLTLHMDAYQIYSRAAEAAYDGEWFGWTAQILIQSLHNVWLLMIRPLLPDSAGIWSPTASEAGVGASMADYRRFIEYDHVHRAVFLMKLPYVVADLATAWVLTRLVVPGRRFAVAAFWLLNPLVIYATAVFGRHDVIAILLVLLSLLAARRATDSGRLVGLVLLGIATLMRFFPVVLVPYYLLAFRKNRKQLAVAVGVLAGLWAAVELFGIIGTGESPTLEIIDTHQHFQNWLDAGVRLRFDDFIFFFPLVYMLALFWFIERDISPDEYPTVAAGSFLLLFGLTFFHPHWSIWLVPFLALTIATNRTLIAYHALQVVLLGVYFMQWGSWTTWELLRPTIGDRVASLPDPYEAIAARIEPRQFFGAFRSILTAVSLWMAWKLIEPLRRRQRA
ncbi:MAG: glycosyltransferase 87 family protein [Thermomicrobiales bacterium]